MVTCWVTQMGGISGHIGIQADFWNMVAAAGNG